MIERSRAPTLDRPHALRIVPQLATSRSHARPDGQIRSLSRRNGRSTVSQSNAPAAMLVEK